MTTKITSNKDQFISVLVINGFGLIINLYLFLGHSEIFKDLRFPINQSFFYAFYLICLTLSSPLFIQTRKLLIWIGALCFLTIIIIDLFFFGITLIRLAAATYHSLKSPTIFFLAPLTIGIFGFFNIFFLFNFLFGKNKDFEYEP